MTKAQGDFGSEAAGQRAVDALVASGVTRDRIRIWNLIPSDNQAPAEGTAVVGGAAAGFIIGGVRGLVAGTVIGASLDAEAQDGPHLPAAAGVRVVVDLQDGGGNVLEILASCGAGNLVTLS